MNAVIYARYSSDKQNEHSIERQLEDCMAFAKSNNLIVIDTYIDRALSARSDKRPQFQQMIEDSEKKLFQAVIVYRLDRFSRNRYDSAVYKSKLKKNGVSVMSAMENITDSPESIIIESLYEGMAEFYSAELSQKVKKGMALNARKGRFNGAVLPYGYTVGEDRKLQINPAQAPVVRRIFEMYADGHTMKEILETVNAKYCTKFTRNSFTTLLRNKKYIGKNIYAGIETECPAIVSEELFNKVQNRFKINKRAPGRSKAMAKYYLSGKVMCGICNGSYVGDSCSKQDKRYYYYTCNNRKNKNLCDSKPIPKEKLEQAVIDETMKHIFVGNNVEKIADAVIEAQKKEAKNNATLNVLQSKYNDVAKRLNNVEKAIEMGVITNTTKNRLQELEKEAEELAVQIKKEEFESGVVITKEQVIYFIEGFRNGDVDDPSFKENICQTFINKIVIDNEKLTIFYNYKENGELSSSDYADLVKHCTQKPEIFISYGIFGLSVINEYLPL